MNHSRARFAVPALESSAAVITLEHNAYSGVCVLQCFDELVSMSVSPVPRSAALELMYHCYLADQDLATYMERVSRRYQPATLTRLMQIGARMTRRAAALGLGLFAGYDTNAELAAALHDEDRGVRMLAENAMRSVWCRQGDAKQQGTLDAVIRLNEARDFNHALRLATQLIEQAPELAEAWNQRAIASFRLGRYLD
ncbi:MAG TPA: hypothetical protein VHV77_02565, partial [Pirellulales bacterium]|nr:hypothetical protein [Pirellulales bacterium]